ncbi:MAG: ABC transporter permease [Ferruginibacter sp.]
MIKNLFLTALRNFKKNKFFSLLNILGLGIGMAVFLLIAQYVKFERSYEDFIPGRNNIYRVKVEGYNNQQQVIKSAENFPGVGPALKTELPEVKSFARLYNMGYKNNVVITNPDAKPGPIALKQRKFLYADSSFLSMMDYPMVKGNANTALGEPFTAVLSETYAKIYFGNEDPIGKTLRLQDDDFNNELVKVTGVFKDLPANTHLKFNILFSYKTLFGRFPQAPVRYGTGWRRRDMYVFVELQPGADPKKIEAKFPAIVAKYQPETQQGTFKNVLGLQPLADIHLNSDLAEEPEPNGNGRTVFFLGIIGLFVLAIAWINYINLSTARAMERAKEVGVRKVIGAFKRQLIMQFLVEAGWVNLIAVILACCFVLLSLSFFNDLSGLSLNISYLMKPWFIGLLLTLWLAGTFLSGFYPALVLSSFKPIAVLKGKLRHNSSGVMLRKGLVVMQFMASIALIAGTFIVYRQLNYMMKSNLGMNIDQVLTIERPGIADTSSERFNSAIDVFKSELKKDPSVIAVAASLTVPGKQREFKVVVKKYANDNADSAILRVNTIDYDFVDLFRMKMIAGRNFSKDYPKDTDTSAIITESAATMLGYKNPADAIGQTLVVPQFNSFKPIVVGVVNDYHQVSLKKPLDPGIFICAPYQGEFYSLRLHTSDMKRTLEHAKQSWVTAFPGNPFEYNFLDDYFNAQYANEQKFTKLFTCFAILAIIIGCLGLFGLSAYTASLRIKEIGIRKVLGASVKDITTMLSKDFLRLVIIAIIIATPLAWWLMDTWLQDFAYRINIKWWIFALAGAVALAIAMLTVSYQAIKAAMANPVKSLRTE